MKPGMTTNVDVALLVSEWNASGDCPLCGQGRTDPAGHQAHCAMDLALAERGYPTQAERNVARDRIHAGNAPTDPPPTE